MSEWQVNYKDGDTWYDIDEATMLARLSMRYNNVGEIRDLMRTDGEKYQPQTEFAVYRRNPEFIQQGQ